MQQYIAIAQTQNKAAPGRNSAQANGSTPGEIAGEVVFRHFLR